MSNDNETTIPRVDRKTANKLNPAICDTSTAGTCERVSRAMKTLAYMVSAVEDSPVTLNASDFYLLQEMLAAALDYEAQQDEEAKKEPKEPPVKRVK